MAQIKGQRRFNLQYPPSPRVDAVHEGAKAFAASQGRTYSSKGLDQLQVDSARGYRQQQSYSENMRRPASPETMRSYDALKHEIGQQFDFMTRPKEQGGLGIKHELATGDPYATHHEMVADVARGRIKTLPTEPGAHTFLDEATNDKFRAIHDVFGHAGIGRGFSRHGEEAAYQSHAQMFSPEARPALAAETRGQNSVLNFTPGGGKFLDVQTPVDVPKWAVGSGKVPPAQRKKIRQSGSTQLPLF